MDFLNLLLQPTGFWENIIFGLETVVKDYGLTLILITLIIKAVMLPFDLLNKYITRNNSRKQAKLKPQLEKLQKAYANNQQLLNQKTMELYKKENFSVMGTCLGMLANMAVTMLVFFTLFASLNNIATYKQVHEFETLQHTYYSVVLEAEGQQTENLTQEEFNNLVTNLTQEQLAAHATAANEAVVEQYGEIRASFLWVKNIWKADTSTSAVLTYKEFKKAAKNTTITEAQYNEVMNPIKEVYGGANGWYILIVLSAATTYLSMQLTTLLSKQKAKRQGKVFTDPMGSNKILIYVMPAVMALFTLLYNAAFGIYIVTGGLFMLITSPFVTMLAEFIDEKVEEKENSKNKISYSRK